MLLRVLRVLRGKSLTRENKFCFDKYNIYDELKKFLTRARVQKPVTGVTRWLKYIWHKALIVLRGDE